MERDGLELVGRVLLVARPELRRALRAYDGLGVADRAHVLARAVTCPLEAVADAVPAGRVLEVGCGLGLLSTLLATRGRTVLGIDPDPRKIASARRLAGVSGLSFEAIPVEALLATGFDSVVLCDVLYLVPRARWAVVLRACASALAPGGTLVVKEAGTRPRWKRLKATAQELAMVRLFGRTLGEAITFVPEAELLGELSRAGLVDGRSTDLSRGFSTPHALYVARRAP